MANLTERILRLGELKLAQILCELEDHLAKLNGKEKAEKFVNKIEQEILSVRKTG